MKARKRGYGSEAELHAPGHGAHGRNQLPAVAAAIETNAMIPISRLRITLAMVPPLGALILQWLFWPYIQPFVWFLFYPAVFFSSWIGGLRGGLVATFISTALVVYFFIPPGFSFAVENPRYIPPIVMFAGMGVLFSLFHGRLRQSRQLAVEALASASSANNLLETRVLERTEALRESEELFSKAFRLSPDLVVIMRIADYTVIRANEALCRLWGSTPEEVIGNPIKKYTNWLDEEERLAFLRTLQAKGEYLGYETTLRMVDGRLVPFSISSRGITLNGQACIMIVMRDITERRLAEVASRAISAIVESSDDAIIGKDLHGIVTSWNPGAEKIFGYATTEMIGASILRVIPPERRAEEVGIIEQIERGESVRHFETERVRKDGQLVDISVTVSPIKDAGGRVVGASKVARDISERKKAEAALLASKAQLDAAIASMTDAIFISDTGGRFIEFNEAFATFHRFRTKEECAKTFAEYPAFLDVFMADGKPAPLEQWAVPRALRGETVKNAEYTLHRKDTGETWIGSYSFAPIRDRNGAIVGSVVAGRDITDQKQAEKALCDSNKRFASIFNLSPVATSLSTVKEGRYLDVNDGFLKMFQRSRNEVVGRTVFELNTWVDLGQRDALFSKLKEDGVVNNFEMKLRAKSGQVIQLLWSGAQIVIDGESFLLGSSLDITERKQAEEKIRKLNTELEQRVIERTGQLEAANTELRHNQAELKSLFESLPGLYLVFTPDLTIVAASDAYLKATLTTRDGILGRRLFDVFPDNPDDPGTKAVANLQASIDRVLKNAASDTMAIAKHDVRRADGSFEEHYWSPVNSPMFGDGRQIKYIVHRVEEVTDFVRHKSGPSGGPAELSAREQQMAAEMFQNAQRLAATNQQLESANNELEAFSYSVSHDLRAPLRAVDGFSQAVLEDFGPKLPAEGLRQLLVIRESAQRMGQLIDDLLSFSRLSRQPLVMQSIDTEQLVRGALGDFNAECGGRKIEINFGALEPCEGDPALVKQVWVNLLSNALKYTRKREHAVVDIGCVEQKGEHVFFVRDNGTGFDMQYAHKLFGVFQRLHRAEEFEGTGVGLAIVQRVIHRHGGRVWAEAAVNRGATFYFTLREKNKS